jgi:hypothetical protein
MDQDQESPAPSSGTTASTPTPKPEDAFDLWLNKSLHQLYDGVTDEPIPAELLKLIEEDRSRRRK